MGAPELSTSNEDRLPPTKAKHRYTMGASAPITMKPSKNRVGAKPRPRKSETQQEAQHGKHSTLDKDPS